MRQTEPVEPVSRGLSLVGSDQPLVERYDLTMLDLDGVVYIGGAAVVGAPEHLCVARERGAHLAFVTNNAARAPEEVAAHLSELGVPATHDDVVTSAQAAARVLRARFGVGARIAVLGGPGLETAVRAQDLLPVEVGAEAVAIVSGFGPDVLWRTVMRAAVLIRDGLPWVASNTDLTLPTPFGPAPGHGVLVKLLTEFSGVTPEVAGKPSRPLLDETVRRVGGTRPLMVGDRLDTDIDGALNAGVASLLVLTGVTGLTELVSVPAGHRPDYLAPDLAGLLTPHPAPDATESGEVVLGEWTGSVVDSRLVVTGQGTAADWWRVVAVTAWRHLDLSGEVVATSGLTCPVETGE